MSSAGAGPSKRRGQYASRACNGCRRRRCKCDGAQPTCGTCGFYGRECSWSLESDARRPVTKQLVESLRVKIQLLEAEVAQLKATTDQATAIPRNPSTTPGLLADGSGSFDGSIPASPVQPTVGSPSGLLLPESRSVLPLQEQPEDLFDVERPHPPSAQLINIAMYRYIFRIDTSIPSSELPKDAQISLTCEWNRHLPHLGDIQLSRFEHDALLQRCFSYGTSWCLGLIPELFLHDMLYSLTSESQPRTHPRMQHYSPLLHCSLMAFATALSDNPIIRAPTTRTMFAARAKQWLDDEFRRPGMALVRALALLAEYHCGIGERDTGYMYMGMSFRAARALILSSDSEPWENEGFLAFPESLNRDWHFWSAFAQDKIMALDYERDYDIPIPRPSISLPSVDVELDKQPWLGELAQTSPHNGSPPNMTTRTFLETCKLLVISTRVIDIVHRQALTTPEERTIINTHLQLDTWFNGLPEDLLVWARSTSPLPHVIVLHVCYWWIIIRLHQPFYHKAQEPEQDPRMPITDLSIKMCDRAAHKIVQLINMFNEHYGIRFFPRSMLKAIFTAGMALLQESAAAPAAAVKKRSYAQDNVGTCIQALNSLSETWPCARELSNELQSQLQHQSQFPTPSLSQNDLTSPIQMEGLAPIPPGNFSTDQELEDQSPAEISQTFNQFLREWERMQPLYPYGSVRQTPGADSYSESSFSLPGDMLHDMYWDGTEPQ